MRSAVCLPVLVAALLASGCEAEPMPTGTAGTSLLELRMEHPAAGEGVLEVEFGGESLYMGPAVIGEVDIDNVIVHERYDGLMLDIRLAPNAAQRLQDTTAAATGRRLLIVVDGEVRAAPTIQSPVGGAGTLQGHVAAEPGEAELLADRIRRRWPLR